MPQVHKILLSSLDVLVDDIEFSSRSLCWVSSQARRDDLKEQIQAEAEYREAVEVRRMCFEVVLWCPIAICEARAVTRIHCYMRVCAACRIVSPTFPAQSVSSEVWWRVCVVPCCLLRRLPRSTVILLTYYCHGCDPHAGDWLNHSLAFCCKNSFF